MLSSGRILLPLLLSLSILLPLGNVTAVQAQRRATSPPSGGLVSALDVIQRRLPREKLYLQLDKPYYAVGDTIWFKGYLLNADSLDAAYRSGVMYLELADSYNNLVQRISLPVVGGLSWGDLPLDPNLFRPGNYTIRAYTNWMLNVGEAGIFSKQISIAGAADSAWTISLQQKIEGDKAAVRLQVDNMLKQPLAHKDLQVSLLKDEKLIHKNSFTIDGEGRLNLNFDMPKAGAGHLVLDIQDASSHEVRIPLFLHLPEGIDLQFMPEGGQLVAGVRQKIGFKAIAPDGKGMPVQGKVYDDLGQQVASFQSLHAGMGSFFIQTQGGGKYYARLTFPDSMDKSYPLPQVQSSGTVLEVTKNNGKDSLQISIEASTDIAGQNPAFIILGQAGGGQLIYYKKIRVTKKGALFSIPVNLFPEGVARFTLFDLDYRPLNERLAFIRHGGDLKINLYTDKPAYHPHDSIALHVAVKNALGQPVFGNFSLAVTDDNQVKISPATENILSYFHLSSYVKGYVEDPFYYFQDSVSTKDEALDNLLLTQGWVGYDWKDVFNPPQKPAYEAEKAFEVKGTVINALNQPIKNAKVSLVSQKPALLRTTKTDQDGQFIFKDFPPIDTPRFFIQALNRHGKRFNVGIDVKGFDPPSLTPVDFPLQLPWNVNMSEALSNYVKNEQEELRLRGHMLKPVEVKAKKIIPNSQNLNGPGEADIVIDENEIKKAGSISLAEFLRTQIHGFNIMDTAASLNGYDVRFIIEGMSLQYVSGFKTDPLNTLTTDQIKGIEIMYSPRYVNSYDAAFTDRRELFKRKKPVAFIEITTKYPTTLWEQKKPGVFLYTPIPFSWPKEFYRPRYALETDGSKNVDLRSTIHWQPNINMEKEGQGLVTFYAADRPGVYTVILEGSDMEGHIGYGTAKIKIEDK